MVSAKVRSPRDKTRLTAKLRASSQVDGKIRIHFRQARTRPARIGTVGFARCEGTGGLPVLSAPALAQTVVMTDS